MKMEMKVFILSFIFSLFFIGIFTYFIQGMQKNFYVLQVGIYQKEENKNEKVKELEELGITGEFYKKDDKYYVFAFLSDDKKEVEEFQDKNNIKGIIKVYYRYCLYDKDTFIKTLKDGEV